MPAVALTVSRVTASCEIARQKWHRRCRTRTPIKLQFRSPSEITAECDLRPWLNARVSGEL